MQYVSKQEIVCIFDGDQSTPIFDKDDWQNQNSSQDTIKQNSKTEKTAKEGEPVDKIKQQIQKSKQNFFKVNLVKKPNEGSKKTSAKQENSNSSKLKLPAINSQNKNSILIQGYVNKKTEGFFFKWNKRYLVLTSEKLYFFQSHNKVEVMACVNLKLLPTKIKDNQNQLIMDFMGECQNIILKIQSQTERANWKKWFKEVIEFQAKQNKIMIKTLVKPLYDSKDTISQKQFVQTAQTGDILLFYTKNTGAKLQRLITNSEFDHVAMIVKMRKNQLMVFESNQLYGVSIYDWRQYVQYFDLYQKITLRKLQYIKKADVQRELLNFVKKNLGKSYDISMSKLVTLQSDVNWDTINKQKTKERGYFCSQLIAKAFKSVGLFDQKKSSGRYWPVDFAQKNGMMLKKGAYLGKQQLVLLNKHLKNYI